MPIDVNEELTKVKLIKRQGKAALVEFVTNGNVERVNVPSGSLVDINSDPMNKFIEKSELLNGIPYGLPWSDIIKISHATPTKIQVELNRVGIWTREDLIANQQSAIAALQRVLSLDVAKLNVAAKQYVQGGK